MKSTSILIVLVLFFWGRNSYARQNNPLLTPVYNFHVKYSESKPVASLRIPLNEQEARQLEGKTTFLQCARLNPNVSKASVHQIIDAYTSIVKRYSGKILYQGDSFASYFLTRGTKEYWLVVETYNKGESYSLAMLEKEAIRIDVSLRQFLSTLNTKGHVPIYINFASGDAVVPEGADIVLKNIAQLLRQNESIKLSIEGHSDNVGSAANNKILSEQRAISVMNKLIDLGVTPHRLTAVGKGQDDPVASNDTARGREKNRRVELVKQ